MTSIGWPALLHHQSGGLDAQLFDRLGRRLAGLGAECTAELSRTEMRRCGQLSNRQRLIEITLRIGQRALERSDLGSSSNSAENCD